MSSISKTYNYSHYFFSSLLLLILTLGGCSSFQSGSPTPSSLEENADPPCSYFYFLWGSHAEYDQHFEEALEAFEKAAICDPTADYIAEKIPILLIKLNRMDEAIVWLENYLQENPEKTIQRFLLARLKIQVGAIQEAIDLYKEALLYDPENNNIQLRLGLLFSQNQQFDEAKEILTQLLNEETEVYFASLYLARLLVKTQEYVLAAEMYKKALSTNWSTELLFETADFYSSVKKYEDSLKLYTTILEGSPDDNRAALGIIQSLLYLKRHDEALAKLAIFRDKSPEPHKIDLIIAQILVSNNAYPQAETLLQSLVTESPSSEAFYMLSVALFEQGKLSKALETLKNISPKTEEFEYSIYLQIKIFRTSKQPAKARELLEETLQNEDSRYPIFYTYLSTLYRDIHNISAALKILADGVTVFPLNDRLHFEYGLLLDKANMPDQAISSMKKVLELKPDHAEALNYLGYSWASSNTNLSLALEYLQRAVLLKPKSGYIRDSLGWVYYRLGNFEQAIIELENAITLEPMDPHIYDHLGDSYLAISNTERALEKYKKALEIFEDEDNKKLVQEKIDALSEL